jgi:hypothetical protein
VPATVTEVSLERDGHGLLSAYVAVHENGRYVKLTQKGPFPRLGCGA